MTAHKDLKRLVRARTAQTGEPYATARARLTRDSGESEATTVDERVEAAVLKVSAKSARVQILGGPEQITVRAAPVVTLTPGQIAELRLTKRWTWLGDNYATASIASVRTDIAGLGLEPLPLKPCGMDDPGEDSEPYGTAEPWAPLWERFTGKPRPAFEFHPIAWKGRAAFDSGDPDDMPVSDAAETYAAGDPIGARAILMDVLCDDLRCIDAHGRLGSWAFEVNVERALLHYEIATGIGELSLRDAPAGLLLPWGLLYNRPYLRALHGLALCHWRLGRLATAELLFEKVVALNPVDNTGARFCWHDVREGRSWEQANGDDARA